MAQGILELADAVWREEIPIDKIGFMVVRELEEVIPGVAFAPSFANVSAFHTDAGLVLVDTGSALLGAAVYQELRRWSKDPVHTVIYTHGHIDHVCGMPQYDEEAGREGFPKPTVIAHEAILARFQRYRKTAGYNTHINSRQFRAPIPWPTEYRRPDITYRDQLSLTVGGTHFSLHHARGETDDATWVWIPEHKTLCTGDLFVWVSPNCGNPQKVQRYPEDWALALRKMATLNAELLLPGHGLPIHGKDRVHQALTETAEYIESIVEQTLALMNEGTPLEDILEEVEPPLKLMKRPYLQAIYDEPNFIVRNLWRLYGGWYDGNPAHLKPPHSHALGQEIVALCGGDKLAQRAKELAHDGKYALACEIIEFAARGNPEDTDVQTIRENIYAQRAKREQSLMAASIFKWAAKHPPKAQD